MGRDIEVSGTLSHSDATNFWEDRIGRNISKNNGIIYEFTHPFIFTEKFEVNVPLL